MKFCTCYTMQKMNQIFCKKQKRGRLAFKMLKTANLS
jgi:hypothetical protein